MHWQDLQDQMKQNQFLNSILIGASDYSKECILKMCFKIVNYSAIRHYQN